MQTEAERQYYLNMVGIRLWYARSPQPGSAPSPGYDFGEPEPPVSLVQARPHPVQTANRQPTVRGVQRTARLADLRGLLSKESSEEKKPDTTAQNEQVSHAQRTSSESNQAASTALVAPESTVMVQAEPLPVVGPATQPMLISAHWGIWSSDNWRLVSAVSSDASMQLLDNLARAILQAMRSDPVSSITLRWPVFNNPEVTGNDEKGLRELLQEITGEQEPRKVIALGLCQDGALPDREKWLQDALGTLVVDYEHSLAGIATDPGRKRELWSRLRGLSDNRG